LHRTRIAWRTWGGKFVNFVRPGGESQEEVHSLHQEIDTSSQPVHHRRSRNRHQCYGWHAVPGQRRGSRTSSCRTRGGPQGSQNIGREVSAITGSRKRMPRWRKKSGWNPGCARLASCNNSNCTISPDTAAAHGRIVGAEACCAGADPQQGLVARADFTDLVCRLMQPSGVGF